MAAVLQWMQENGLRLNPDKTEVLRVGAPPISGLGSFLSFVGMTFTTKSVVHSLGVHLDPALGMESHVASVVYTTHLHLRQIGQLHSYLDVGALTTLVHAFIISRRDYCNALYMGLPLRLMQKMQMVQNTASRLLTGVKKYHHISPTLVALHWLPICFCIDFKVLILTYKALNGLGPRYLTERLLPPSSTRVT